VSAAPFVEPARRGQDHDDVWREANAAHAYVAWLRRQPDSYWPQLIRNPKPSVRTRADEAPCSLNSE